jgi:hypothetical protein
MPAFSDSRPLLIIILAVIAGPVGLAAALHDYPGVLSLLS